LRALLGAIGKRVSISMNAEIEAAVQKMIDEHGWEKVKDALTPLIGDFKWSDWQRVYDLARRMKPPEQAKPAKRRKSDAPG
jgi:hypothetical protein